MVLLHYDRIVSRHRHCVLAIHDYLNVETALLAIGDAAYLLHIPSYLFTTSIHLFTSSDVCRVAYRGL